MPSGKQLARVWAAAREVSLDEEGVRSIVLQVSGQPSLRALTPAEYDDVVTALVRLGASKSGGDGRAAAAKRGRPSGARRAANETALRTPSQLDLVQQLRADIGGRLPEDEYFTGFCRKVIGVAHPRTAAETAKVIEALKKRRAWERKRRTGALR